MAVSGYKVLYKVKFWGWDGSSREIDPYTGDPVESLLTSFVYAFFEDVDLPGNFEDVSGFKYEKIESVERATDDEEVAFEYGWMASNEGNNDSYGNME